MDILDKKNENNEQVVNKEQVVNDEANLEKEVITKVNEQLKNEKKIEIKPDEAEKINEAIKRGFTTAKNQLHADITKSKDKVKELETEKAELAKQLTALQTAAAEKKDESKDTSVYEAEMKVLSDKLKLMEDTATEAVMKVTSLEKSLQVKELEAYKNKLIAEAKGELIAGLVTGNTPEEIEASVKNAQEEYKKIVNAERKNLNLPTREEEKGTKDGNEKEIEIPNVNLRNAKQLEREYEREKERIKSEIYRKNGFNI